MRALHPTSSLDSSKLTAGAHSSRAAAPLPARHSQPLHTGWLHHHSSRDGAHCPQQARILQPASALPRSHTAPILAASTLTREQQQQQQQEQQHSVGWNRGTEEEEEEGVFTDIPLRGVPPSAEEDLEYLQELQAELEGLAGLRQGDNGGGVLAEETASVPTASLQTTGQKTRRGASKRSASPATSAPHPPASRKGRPRRAASAPAVLSSSATASSTTATPAEDAASKLRTPQRARSLELPQPTHSMPHTQRRRASSRRGLQGIDLDRVIKSGRGTRQLLSRDEEGALAMVARDGMHIELGARQLAGVLRREPTTEELARALKADPRELQERTKASLAARRMLLQANYGLVKRAVMQHTAAQRGRGGNCLPFEDSMEAGLQGLLRAVMKFNPEAGFKLSTYAMIWIRNELQRAQNQADLFRVPESYAISAAQLMHVQQQLKAHLDRNPSHEETRQELGWNERKYSQVYRAAMLKHVAAQATSLESSLDDESTQGLDAKMSFMLSKPMLEEGWEFSSSASAVTGSIERDEMLAKDLQALMHEALEECQQQQQQQQQAASSQGPAIKAAGSDSSNSSSGGAGLGDAAHTASGGDELQKDDLLGPGSSKGARSRSAAAHAHSSSADSTGDGEMSEGVSGGVRGGAHEKGSARDTPRLSPLHLEVLRLRLGLAGMHVPAAEARLRDIEARGVSGYRGKQPASRSSSSSERGGKRRSKRGARARVKEAPQVSEEAVWAQWAAAKRALEQQVLSGKPAAITHIAAVHRITPSSVYRLELEALEWLKQKKAHQVAEIMKGHDLEVDREAGMLPRSAGGAHKKH